MCVINTGDRIKYYRSLLHLTRKELSANGISSKMIYLLENNKKKLTPVTASLLVSSFHKNAKENGIQINLEIKDLLMSDDDYADNLCNKWLSDIKESSFDETKYLKVIELAEKYNLNEPLLKAYDKISSCYYNQQNYIKALEFLKKLLPLSFLINNKKDEIIIFNKVGTCCYVLQHYDKAFYYYHKGYEEFVKLGIIDPELEDKLLYNLALCCSVTKNYKDTLMYIEKLESVVNVDTSEMYTNLILKATTYLNMNRVEEALSIYKEVLNNDIKYLYIVQNNMALAFMRLGRLDESIEYFTKSINNQLDSLSPDTTLSLTELADAYYRYKKHEEAFIFYGYGLDNAKKFKQLDKIIECYEKLYKACEGMSKIEKFDSYYKSMRDLYSDFSFNEEQLKKLQIIEQNYISNIIN